MIKTIKHLSTATIQSQPAVAAIVPIVSKNINALRGIRKSLKPALKGNGLRLKDMDVVERKPYDPVVNKSTWLFPQVSADGTVPEFMPDVAFANALAIGSPLDIFKTYNLLRENKASLKKVPEEQFLDLLTRCSKGHFGFLFGFTLFNWSRQIRDDFVLAGYTPSPAIDALVIECASFIPAEYMPLAIKFARQALVGLSDSVATPIYNALLKILGTNENVQAAEALFEKIKVPSFQTYTAMCGVYALNGHVTKAEALYIEWKSKKDISGNVKEFYTRLIRGYALVGDLQNTRKYFSYFSPSDPIFYRVIAHSALIRCYSEKGLPGDAGMAYKTMRDEGLAASPQVYESLIRVCIMDGDIASANRWYRKAVGVATFRPSMGMFTALIETNLKAGESLVAWRCVTASMAAFKKARSKSSRVYIPFAMTQVLAADLRGKHIDYLRDRIRLAFVPMVHRGGLIAKMMHSALYPSDSNGDVELALKLYGEYVADEGCVKEAEIPVMAHINAIKAYGMKGSIKEAVTIFNEMIDTDFVREGDAYNALLGAYASCNDKKGLMKLYQEMKGQGLKASVSTYEALLAGGGIEQSVEVAKEIDEAGIVADVSHPLVCATLSKHGFGRMPGLTI